ncbi:MAG: glutamate racemase [Candidatus Omnitrophota bacterium]
MKHLKDRSIGIFDSGIGGLTVAKGLRRELPGENIVYFGDTARVPYGNKSRETIIRFACEIVEFLSKKNVKMIVVACNTASSFSLNAIKKIYEGPVIGVISPGMEDAVIASKTGRIGVIGTRSTINSRSYDKEAAKYGKRVRLFSKSCPLFVPLVENKFSDDKIAYDVAKRYLEGLKKKDIDTLILGCTHYPIMKKVIGKVMKDVTLIDSANAVSKMARKILEKKDLLRSNKRSQGWTRCYVSDDVDGFKKNSGIFFESNTSIKKVVL